MTIRNSGHELFRRKPRLDEVEIESRKIQAFFAFGIRLGIFDGECRIRPRPSPRRGRGTHECVCPKGAIGIVFSGCRRFRYRHSVRRGELPGLIFLIRFRLGKRPLLILFNGSPGRRHENRYGDRYRGRFLLGWIFLERNLVRGKYLVRLNLGNLFRRNLKLGIFGMGNLFRDVRMMNPDENRDLYEKRERNPDENRRMFEIRRLYARGFGLPLRETRPLPVLHPGHRRGLRNRGSDFASVQHGRLPDKLSVFDDGWRMYGRRRILRQRGNGLLNDPDLDVCRFERGDERELFEGERRLHVSISDDRILWLPMRLDERLRIRTVSMMVIRQYRNGILRR